MRVSKSIKIEFIARGRIWYIVFHTAPDSSSSPRAGSWLVTLGLADNSQPTHLDSWLIVADAGLSHSTPPRTDFPSADRALGPITITTLLASLPIPGIPRRPGPGLQHQLQHCLQQQITPRLGQLANGIDRIADRIHSVADAIAPRHMPSKSEPGTPPLQWFSGGQTDGKKPRPTISLRFKTGSKMLSPPGAQEQVELTVPLEESLMGATLQYENSAYIDSVGTLKARLEARLAKPDSDSECIIR